MKELLMGNEAIAVGALAAGVQVVAGYPGTPSSEVVETIARRSPGGVYVEWSVNEKAGAEVAAGAAYSGARSMVTMKQMGLNVASDPVMCVNYIGIKGGMVIYVADDPGPISSQTEQDTRHFGQYARIPVFDCDSPEQAFRAVQEAFAFSEDHRCPVILRSTTRVCHACADIDVPELRPPEPAEGFVKDAKWVIFPGLSYRNKQRLVKRESEFSDLFSRYPGNRIETFEPAIREGAFGPTPGNPGACNPVAGNPGSSEPVAADPGASGRIGIACGGISYAYAREALAHMDTASSRRFTLLKIGTPYPFPQALAAQFLRRVSTCIVFEELDPVIEDALIYLQGRGFDGTGAASSGSTADSGSANPSCSDVSDDSDVSKGSGNPSIPILGKRSGTVPAAGELSAEIVEEILLDQLRLLSSCPDTECSSLRAPSADEAEKALTDGADPVAPDDGDCPSPDGSRSVPDLPVRPPVLCAGCPHRGSFYAVKAAVSQALRKAKAPADKASPQAASPQTASPGNAAPAEPSETPVLNGTSSGPAFRQAVYHGDIGCYTLGNAAPLNMVDTCLCMGAGITMAQGMHRADAGTLNFAFVGDSTFFASGITGTINAVYNQSDMILCVLDNSTTAMTGHQPHPGMGITMMGQRVDPIRIDKVLEGIGVPWIRTVDPLDLKASRAAVSEAIGQKGVRAIIFKSPCIALTKGHGLCRVEEDACVGCQRCIKEIGCPALSPAHPGEYPDAPKETPAAEPLAHMGPGQKASADPEPSAEKAQHRAKAVIDPSLCTGCGLCAQICPAGCIRSVGRDPSPAPADPDRSTDPSSTSSTSSEGKEASK